LNGYIRYVRTQQQGKQEYGERAIAIKEEELPYIVADSLSDSPSPTH
jgi:hypothetical protein